MTLQKRIDLDSNKLERWGDMLVPSARGIVVKFYLTYFTNQTSTTYKSIFSSSDWHRTLFLDLFAQKQTLSS